MNPLSVRENHPAGLTAAIVGPLTVIIIWIAQLLGAEMTVEVAAAIAGLATAAITAIVSARSPRVTIPDLPAVESRGIESDTSGEFTEFVNPDTGPTGSDE